MNQNMYHGSPGGYQTPWNSSYHSIPTGPNMGYYNQKPSAQPFDPRHLPNRKSSQTGRVLLITVLLAGALIVPFCVWAWYVSMHERTIIDWAARTIYTTAGPTQFLLLSTVCTTVTKILLGPIMALYAFTASADWLASTEHGRQYRLPTPIQYVHVRKKLTVSLGSLFSLFHNASVMSLLTAFRGASNPKQLAWPPVLKKAVALLVWLLFLAYSLTSVSLWLQIDAKPTTAVPGSTDFASQGYNAQTTLFARTVNQTLCAEANERLRRPTCGLSDYSATAQAGTMSSTAKMLSNNSDVSRVAWLNDNLAILVPATTPTIGYQAKALGVRAVCRSVTTECASCNSTASDVVVKCAGPLAGPTIFCPAPAKVNVTTNSIGDYQSSGPVSPTNGTKIFQDFKNPMSFGDVILSSAYRNTSLQTGGLDYFVGTTGFLNHGRSVGVNVIYCDLAVYDVSYEFSPPETYTSTSWKLSDTTTAGYVGYGLVAWFGKAGRGFEQIDGAGQSGNATYPEIYARHLNKIAISSVSSIIPATSSERLMPGQTSGAQVTLIGMLILLLLIGCTVTTILAVGLHATLVNLNTNSNFLAAARGRLISVYPLIGDSFGGLHHDFQNHGTAVSAGMSDKAFIQETEADRLHLLQDDIDGGPMRGMTVRLRPRRV